MNLNRLNWFVLACALLCFAIYTMTTGFTELSMLLAVIFAVWTLLCIPPIGSWYRKNLKYSVPIAALITALRIIEEGFSNEAVGTFLLIVVLAYPLLFYPAFLIIRGVFGLFSTSLVGVKESLDELNETLDAISSSNKTWLTEEDFYRIFTDDDLQPYRDRGVDLEASVPLWCKFFRAQRIKDLMAAKRIDLVYEADRKYLEKQLLKEDLRKVVGIGEKKVAALVDRFESRTAIRDASPEEIAMVPGISITNAENIRQRLGS